MKRLYLYFKYMKEIYLKAMKSDKSILDLEAFKLISLRRVSMI